jgi:hypothetical protein
MKKKLIIEFTSVVHEIRDTKFQRNLAKSETNRPAFFQLMAVRTALSQKIGKFRPDNDGRWAPAINDENFRYGKQMTSAIVIGNEILRIFWISVEC